MSLTERDSHFEFGENWRSYARSIDRRRIEAAIDGVRKLFPEGFEGKTFLDIGCGSGLHSLAALELGAKSVLAIDIDENSVTATHDTLSKYAKAKPWDTKVISVFDATPESLGSKFDVVYSWGVLHHTGNMWRAIKQASELVRPSGRLCLAIYAATKNDRFWKVEKRIYSRAPKPAQWILRQGYMAALLTRHTLSGRNPISFVSSYQKQRGMNFSHDAHDWLGGYPYETATAEALHDNVCALGFKEVHSFRLPYTTGALGSGCHEFVFETAV